MAGHGGIWYRKWSFGGVCFSLKTEVYRRAAYIDRRSCKTCGYFWCRAFWIHIGNGKGVLRNSQLLRTPIPLWKRMENQPVLFSHANKLHSAYSCRILDYEFCVYSTSSAVKQRSQLKYFWLSIKSSGWFSMSCTPAPSITPDFSSSHSNDSGR